MDVIKMFRKRVDKIGGSDHVVGETSVARPAGKLGRLAKIFAIRRTKSTFPTGAVKPRRPNSLSFRKLCNVRPNFLDDSDNLMSGDNRGQSRRKIALYDVKIRSAYSARPDAQ